MPISWGFLDVSALRGVLVVFAAVASVVAVPAPASNQAQGPPRLRIVNGCGREPIWIGNYVRGSSYRGQNVKIEPLEFHDFPTPPGRSRARFWPKLQCDAQGDHCALGDSGGPAPPIDTKFESVFGNGNLVCNMSAKQYGGCDYVDISLVDGFTLPFRLEVKGQCVTPAEKIIQNQVIDCSHLSVENCPVAEKLPIANLAANLQAKGSTGHLIGCYAPCTKLVEDRRNNTMSKGRHPTDEQVAPYCCTNTPSPEVCHNGPVSRTDFVQAVHHMCPGVHAYSYDDGMSMAWCQASSQYTVTFYCPSPALSKQITSLYSPLTASKPLSEVTNGLSEQTSKLPSCNTVCEHKGKSATCGERIHYAANHRFKNTPNSCSWARMLVQEQCPSCASCTDCKQLPVTTTALRTRLRTTLKQMEAPRQASACVLADSQWESAMVPDSTRRWCCKHTGKGCTNAREKFNCHAGSTWSQTKKDWCCQKEGLGCTSNDCANLAVLSTWSTGKRKWCCTYEKRGCASGDSSPSTDHPGYDEERISFRVHDGPEDQSSNNDSKQQHDQPWRNHMTLWGQFGQVLVAACLFGLCIFAAAWVMTSWSGCKYSALALGTNEHLQVLETRLRRWSYGVASPLPNEDFDTQPAVPKEPCVHPPPGSCDTMVPEEPVVMKPISNRPGNSPSAKGPQTPPPRSPVQANAMMQQYSRPTVVYTPKKAPKKATMPVEYRYPAQQSSSQWPGTTAQLEDNRKGLQKQGSPTVRQPPAPRHSTKVQGTPERSKRGLTSHSL